MQLKDLLAQPQHLPTVPTLVQSLIESFGRDDVSSEKIARLIATDPGLSAKLLRLANSAYFRAARSIGSVDDALKMLGFVMVRNLVIGNGLASACKAAPGMDIKQFWRYSLATACTARWLAAPAQLDPELAFMVGLLHGIGEFPMRTGMAREMKDIDSRVHPLDGGRAEAERDAVGFDHAQVGAALARQWNFPQTIVQAVGAVPGPFSAPPASPMAALVHLAAWRARAHELGYASDKLIATYPDAIAASIAIDRQWMPVLLAKDKVATSAARAMPDIEQLTSGLDEMLDLA
jgi:putative nucleotidyltransferase with HDIG domain